MTTASSDKNPSPLWKSLHLEHWSNAEVSDWIKSAANVYNISSRDRKLLQEKFARHSGLDITAMTVEDFKRISTKYGEILFMTLHSHKQKGKMLHLTTKVIYLDISEVKIDTEMFIRLVKKYFK